MSDNAEDLFFRPARSGGRRRPGLWKNWALHAGVVGVVVLIAANSLPLLVAGQDAHESPEVVTVSARMVLPGAAPPPAAVAAVVLPTAGAKQAAPPVEGRVAGHAAPLRQPEPSPPAPPAADRSSMTGTPATPAPAYEPSERELTFKHGYQQRQAALGRSGENPPASKPKAPDTQKAAQAKLRKDGVRSDGRRVAVQRVYRGYAARDYVADAGWQSGWGRFRAADNRSARPVFAGSYGERRGWFW